ncbi:MAG: LemA family protein [Actinomycetes bacterium]|nr:LemA family protein [Actinomycetes bacterium]
MLPLLLVVLVLIVIIGLWLVVTYNRFVTLRNRVANAWDQVSVQLKRRWDLIPNLVATVKGYAEHESKTLEGVISARNAASVAVSGGVEAQAAAENMLTGALRQLFAVAEAYPDLKANQNFLSLQNELTETENKISFSRQFYNDIVMTYNTALQVFPGNLVAGMFGFVARPGFEIDEAQTEAPQVQF